MIKEWTTSEVFKMHLKDDVDVIVVGGEWEMTEDNDPI